MPEEKITDIFSGEWVLLFEDRIIDHSANIQDMLILAQDKYPNDKYHMGPFESKRSFKVHPEKNSLNNDQHENHAPKHQKKYTPS